MDRNFACRIKCRCGARAPARVEQAAKREAAAARLQPAAAGAARAKGKWVHGPPKPDSEVAKLRAEVAKLREAAKNGGDAAEEAEGVLGDEGEPSIDLQKAQAAYVAIAAAFGPNSKQAKDLELDMETLRESKYQAKPVSQQIRIAERKVRDKRKQCDAAKLAATAAAEAVREAQRHLEAADAKVVQKLVELQDAEKAEAALSSRPTEAAQEATATEPDETVTRTGFGIWRRWGSSRGGRTTPRKSGRESGKSRERKQAKRHRTGKGRHGGGGARETGGGSEADCRSS